MAYFIHYAIAGYCSNNPYARAYMYISKDITNPSVYQKQVDYYIYGYAYYYCTSPVVRNYSLEVALLSPVSLKSTLVRIN